MNHICIEFTDDVRSPCLKAATFPISKIYMRHFTVSTWFIHKLCSNFGIVCFINLTLLLPNCCLLCNKFHIGLMLMNTTDIVCNVIGRVYT